MTPMPGHHMNRRVERDCGGGDVGGYGRRSKGLGAPSSCGRPVILRRGGGLCHHCREVTGGTQNLSEVECASRMPEGREGGWSQRPTCASLSRSVVMEGGEKGDLFHTRAGFGLDGSLEHSGSLVEMSG
jgi:hypothetical protein